MEHKIYNYKIITLLSLVEGAQAILALSYTQFFEIRPALKRIPLTQEGRWWGRGIIGCGPGEGRGGNWLDAGSPQYCKAQPLARRQPCPFSNPASLAAHRPEPTPPGTNQPRSTGANPRLTQVQRRLCCSCRGTAGATGPANWGPRHRDDGRPEVGQRRWLGWPSGSESVGVGFSLGRRAIRNGATRLGSSPPPPAPPAPPPPPAELAAVEGEADQVRRAATAHTHQQLRMVALPAADAPRRALPPAAARTRRPGRHRPLLVLAAATAAAAAAAAVFGTEAVGASRRRICAARGGGGELTPRWSQRSAVSRLMAASLPGRHRRQRPGPRACFIAAET
jgi:hypothetical protein